MTRRSPEQTRELILDAAERVFLHALPDAVGLRDIAREAGTSHALVTHYFGTYEGLTRATLERRIEAMRRRAIERLAHATFSGQDYPMLDLLLEFVEDPVMVRLIAWALLTGRSDALPGPPGALHPLLDAFEARARQLGWEPPPRAQLELLVTGAMAMAFGLAIARAPLERALDRPGALASEVLREELPRLGEALLRGRRAQREHQDRQEPQDHQDHQDQ